MVNFVLEGMPLMVATHGMGFSRKVTNRVIFIEAG